MADKFSQPVRVTSCHRHSHFGVGSCLFPCDDKSIENHSEDEKFVFRVQLDLLKDLQYVGLGENIP